MAGVPIIKATVNDMAKAVRKAVKKNPELREDILEPLANKKGKITPKSVRKGINAETEVEIFGKDGKLTKEGKQYLKQAGKEENFSPKKITWDDVFKEAAARNKEAQKNVKEFTENIKAKNLKTASEFPAGKLEKDYADKFNEVKDIIGKKLDIET